MLSRLASSYDLNIVCQYKTLHTRYIQKIPVTTAELAFSQKRSQCILGSFGGTKYMVTGVKYSVCEKVEASKNKRSPFYIKHLI
jgi:hypothetical protein